ncbi:DUF1330 domain-containing protein [Microbulbifer sp. S227A]|uniref:DUF1330 domain-containing protein n=1 Tax=Microbulbifer sp. S227A TaxID=3415131 RepID=UPI003C7AE528
MPKGYLVAHIRVHDKDRFAEFSSMSGPAIADHGGRVLVRNPTIDHREGAAQGRCIVIEFDSIEQARKFYDSDAYTAARAIRELAAETDLLLVEGV